MKVDFKKSFDRDLRKKGHSKKLLRSVQEIIEQVESAETLHGVNHCKKLKEGSGYFRVKIGNYRIGIVLNQDTVVFVRLLHRSEIYRFFP